MELQGTGIGVSVLCPAQVAATIRDSGLAPGSLGPQLPAPRLAEALPHRIRPSPDAVGERVLHAIRRDEFFVFARPEARARIERRYPG